MEICEAVVKTLNSALKKCYIVLNNFLSDYCGTKNVSTSTSPERLCLIKDYGLGLILYCFLVKTEINLKT